MLLFISVCVPIGYYASYYNIPLFPCSCVDQGLSDKYIYDTMVRVNAVYNKMGRAMGGTLSSNEMEKHGYLCKVYNK